MPNLKKPLAQSADVAAAVIRQRADIRVAVASLSVKHIPTTRKKMLHLPCKKHGHRASPVPLVKTAQFGKIAQRTRRVAIIKKMTAQRRKVLETICRAL
jgi:hypothetical protein